MITVMKSDSPSAEIERVSSELRRWDITPEKLEGKHKVVIGLVGDTIFRKNTNTVKNIFYEH